jgi:hypothetical protein
MSISSTRIFLPETDRADPAWLKDDREYKVLSYVLPYGEETLRMVISVNHRRTDQAVAHPLTREAVIHSDGTIDPPLS